MTRRIYLDNAATSFPKPEAVYQAMDDYQRRLGAAAGRGAYGAAVEAGRLVSRCRRCAAELLGAESPECIVFTFNGTDGLNLAIHGVLEPGDHVVTSTQEHNSVLRPLREEQQRRGVLVTHVPADSAGRIDPSDVRRALRPRTKLIVLIHASNVTGTIQPIAEVGQIAREAGLLFLVDAAQTAGHLPIDLRTLPVDMLACAGHKGLLGPLGTGLLYIRPGVESRLASLRQGGTGTRSEDDRQPLALPEKYESGNLNVPGLVGLHAGLEYLQSRGVAALREHEARLLDELGAGLAEISGLQRHGLAHGGEQVGVVSVTLPGYDAHDLATILDDGFDIQVRAGLHCAPGVHRTLGTFEQGGTVRISLGLFNSCDDIAALCHALGEIGASA